MIELGVDRIREVLAAARDLAPPTGMTPRVQRLAQSRRVRPALAEQFAHMGFDTEAVQRGVAAERAETDRRIAELKAVAVDYSAARGAALHRLIDGWRSPLGPGTVELPPQTTTTVNLDTPFEIWASLGWDVDLSTIEPDHSRIKARYEGTGVLGQGVDPNSGLPPGAIENQWIHFYYLWQNPSVDSYASVTVNAPLILNGFCTAHSDGGFVNIGYAELILEPVLTLLPFWTQPPPLQPNQLWRAVHLIANSDDLLILNGWPTDDQNVTAAVEAGYWLTYQQELVPPGESLVIDVGLYLQAAISSPARVIADFTSGDFEVSSPYVELVVVS